MGRSLGNSSTLAVKLYAHRGPISVLSPNPCHQLAQGLKTHTQPTTRSGGQLPQNLLTTFSWWRATLDWRRQTPASGSRFPLGAVSPAKSSATIWPSCTTTGSRQGSSRRRRRTRSACSATSSAEPAKSAPSRTTGAPPPAQIRTRRFTFPLQPQPGRRTLTQLPHREPPLVNPTRHLTVSVEVPRGLVVEVGEARHEMAEVEEARD